MHKELEEKPSKAGDIALAVVTIGALVGVPTLIGFGCRAAAIDHRKAIDEQTNILQEKGLLGEIPIIDLREVPGYRSSAEVTAGFVFFTGTFRGETTRMMEFAWQPRDDKYFQISQVPTRNIRYLVIDDPNTRPTVQFTGMKPELFINLGVVTDNENVNYYVDEAAAQMIVMTLSKKDWEKFRGTEPTS